MSVSRKRRTRALRAELLSYSRSHSRNQSWFWFGIHLRTKS